MNREELLAEIDLNIQEAKKVVEVGDSLERLRNNRDFKKVIQEGYFRDEAVRLVHLKSDPNFQTPERQQSILLQIDAIGSLDQYFRTLIHTAELAKKAVDAGEEAREEILAEGDEE